MNSMTTLRASEYKRPVWVLKETVAFWATWILSGNQPNSPSRSGPHMEEKLLGRESKFKVQIKNVYVVSYKNDNRKVLRSDPLQHYKRKKRTRNQYHSYRDKNTPERHAHKTDKNCILLHYTITLYKIRKKTQHKSELENEVKKTQEIFISKYCLRNESWTRE